MDLADSLIVAFLAQRIGQDLLKRLFLGLKGDRCRRAEAGVNELRVKLLRIPGEIQDTVDIAAAVVEGREQESSHRSLYPPVPGRSSMALVACIVGETRLESFTGQMQQRIWL